MWNIASSLAWLIHFWAIIPPQLSREMTCACVYLNGSSPSSSEYLLTYICSIHPLFTPLISLCFIFQSTLFNHFSYSSHLRKPSLIFPAFWLLCPWIFVCPPCRRILSITLNVLPPPFALVLLTNLCSNIYSFHIRRQCLRFSFSLFFFLFSIINLHIRLIYLIAWYSTPCIYIFLTYS